MLEGRGCQDILNGRQECFTGDRFCQDFVDRHPLRNGQKCLLGQIGGTAGYSNDFQGRILACAGHDYLKSVGFRHDDVGYYQINLFIQKPPLALSAIFRFSHPVSANLQKTFQDCANLRVIIDQENQCHGINP